MKTSTACLAGIFVLTVFFAGTAFAGKTCEEQEAKEAERLATEAERLATAAGKCEEKLLDNGCDASACQVTVECVPDPVASPQYAVDSVSGTLIDLRTCLEWEKKCDSACGGLHDVDNRYAWACRDGTTGADDGFCQPTQEASDACFAGATIDPAGTEAERTVGCRLCDTNSGSLTCVGTTIWEWILAVNAEGLGGYDDWRIPDKGELASLLAEPFPCSSFSPSCFDAVVGPTRSSDYWSSSTFQEEPYYAWDVSFSFGAVGRHNVGKHEADFVRAVRGGL
jgi:hypothetical protein